MTKEERAQTESAIRFYGMLADSLAQIQMHNHKYPRLWLLKVKAKKNFWTWMYTIKALWRTKVLRRNIWDAWSLK